MIALYRSGSVTPFGLHDNRLTGEMAVGIYVIEVLAGDASTTGTYALMVLAQPTEMQSGEAQRNG